MKQMVFFEDVSHDAEFSGGGSLTSVNEANSQFFYDPSVNTLYDFDLYLNYYEGSMGGQINGGTIYLPSTIDGTTITQFSERDAVGTFSVQDNQSDTANGLEAIEIHFPASYTKVYLDTIWFWAARTPIGYPNFSNTEVHVYVHNPNAYIYSGLKGDYSENYNLSVNLYTDSTDIFDPYDIITNVIPLTSPERTFYAYFNENGATLSKKQVSTQVKTNATKITWEDTLPKITRNGWAIEGFGASANSTKILTGFTSEAKVRVESGQTYYAITWRNVTYRNEAINGCTIPTHAGDTVTFYNTEKTKTITHHFSYITPPEGWKVLGWSENATATTAQYSENSYIDMTINVNDPGKEFYTLIYKTITLTRLIDKDNTSQSKTESKTIYNDQTSASFTLSSVPTDWDRGNIKYWSDGVNHYDLGETIYLSKDLTIYAVWAILMRIRKDNTWKDVYKCYINVVGQNKEVIKTYLKVNGVWKEHA